jgi:hypothetical protein
MLAVLTSPRPPSVNFSGDTAVTDAVITRARRSDRSDDLVETIPSCLGAFLREWRGRRRMSQLALALEAGISARQFSFIERQAVPRLEKARWTPLLER